MATATTTEDLTGDYYPAAPGARSWCEARDLHIGTDRVTCHVDNGRMAYVFIGVRLVFEGELPAEVTHSGHVNPWARDIALATETEVEVEVQVEGTATTTPGQAEADQLRAEARRHEDEARESFERCDTDGFLSQWASGRMAGLKRLEADIAEAGGMWEFPALFDLEGNLVPAKQVEGQYGMSWKLLDDRGWCAGWFNPSKARSDDVQRRNNAKKGYYIGTVRVPAFADMVGTNYHNVHAAAFREDDGWSADAEIIDNGQ